jgi:DNA primase
VARRIPLYRFVLSNVVSRYDLDRADGRIDALREAAKLVVSIRDRSKVDAFARELSGMVGVDVEQARAEVRRAAARGPKTDDRRRPGPSQAGPAGGPGAGAPAGGPAYGQGGEAAQPPAPPVPDIRHPRFSLERETLKLVVQYPLSVGHAAKDVDGNDFTHPTFRAVWEAVAALGGPSAAPGNEVWVSKLREHVTDPAAAHALNALAVEPLLAAKEPDVGYVAAHVFRLQEVTTMRRIADVKSRLQRTNPVDHATEYNRMFGELVALEQHRRNLRERGIGGSDT